MALSKKMNDKLNEQIQKEFFSSYYYLSMEAYFLSVSLDGFANYFSIQANEERDHALKVFNYVNDAGGRVRLLQLAEPKSDFESTISVFKAALEHERFITKSIHDLVEAALEEKDYTTHSFLQWYINEQLEEEKNMENILGKLKFVENDGRGILLLDSELAKRTYTPMNFNEENEE